MTPPTSFNRFDPTFIFSCFKFLFVVHEQDKSRAPPRGIQATPHAGVGCFPAKAGQRPRAGGEGGLPRGSLTFVEDKKGARGGWAFLPWQQRISGTASSFFPENNAAIFTVGARFFPIFAKEKRKRALFNHLAEDSGCKHDFHLIKKKR